jgi:hypothetical protein
VCLTSGSTYWVWRCGALLVFMNTKRTWISFRIFLNFCIRSVSQIFFVTFPPYFCVCVFLSALPKNYDDHEWYYYHPYKVRHG